MKIYSKTQKSNKICRCVWYVRGPIDPALHMLYYPVYLLVFPLIGCRFD